MGTSTSRPSDRRTLLRVAGWSALAILLTVGAGAAAIASPWLRVQTVRVSGASHLSQRRIVRLSGVKVGESTVLFRPGTAVVSLETNPWIASATVQRDLPSTVRIVVHERAPVAAVGSGSGYVEVAADGTVLGTSSKPPALPQVVPAAGGGAGPAVAALGVMPPALRSQIRTATLSTDGTITLSLASSVQVVYGGASQTRAKASALAAVLHWASQNRVRLTSIDVRAPSAPAARPSSPRAVPTPSP